INTILGVIGVNMKNLRPLPTVEGHSIPGGYSYLAVKPIALRMVSELARALSDTSICGIGGIRCADDAFEHILVGAHTVQSCTGPMLHGFEMVTEMIEGLEARLEEHGFDSVQDAVGHSLQFFTTHHDLVDRQAAARAQRKAEMAAKRVANDSEWGKGDFTEEAAALTSER
ncbi:MAG: NAD-dependent dihydropyrimidine dehydrogenase subunit PreA, partial [Myxococcota bacterium]|nr:NAD-dependent dihydropyrimidine dehydrogenase subunit PreA [Myxococcota bacterium]